MAHYSSIYEQLTGTKVDDATISELDFTRNTFIDEKSIEYWKGIITVSKIIDASRTYSHGLPVPESGSIEVATIPNGEVGVIQPTGSEIWLLQGIDTDNCAIFLADGTTTIDISSSAEYIGRTRNPLYITNSLYIVLQNASGSEQTPKIAYHKVSL